jgi:hypothetical protein
VDQRWVRRRFWAKSDIAEISRITMLEAAMDGHCRNFAEARDALLGQVVRKI